MFEVARRLYNPRYVDLFKKYSEMFNDFEKICDLPKEENNLSKEYLINLINTIKDLQHEAMRGKQYRDYGIYAPSWFVKPYQEDIDKVDNKLGELYSPKGFNKPVMINIGDVVNGYTIKHGIDESNGKIMPFVMYEEIKNEWDKPDGELEDYDKFFEAYQENTCTEWAKSDKYGNSYGGYWKYPEDSEEYKNAWTLTYSENCKALYDLPYTKHAIIYLIKICCSMRMDDVVSLVTYCHYFEKLLENIKSCE